MVYKMNSGAENAFMPPDLQADTLKSPLQDEFLSFRKESISKNNKKNFDASIGRDYSEDAKVIRKKADRNRGAVDGDDTLSQQSGNGKDGEPPADYKAPPIKSPAQVAAEKAKARLLFETRDPGVGQNHSPSRLPNVNNFDDQQRGYRGSKLKDGLEALSNYDMNSEYNNQFGHDEMNASFGNNSGRVNRRDSYYQFKRSDSFDSSVGRM